jgi:ethanolamine utilization protein EutN
MRIAEVIGTVTLVRVHPSLVGARWLIGVPCSLAGLKEGGTGDGEDLIVYDELGAGVGSRIGVSEGGEAAAAFYPRKVPVDAYCACILDAIEITSDIESK